MASNNTVAAGHSAYATLVSLRDKAGEAHFQRVQTAAALLGNHAWVEAPDGGGGNESRALDRLASECFGDVIGGVVTMVGLLDLYHHFPELSQWRKQKFDLKRMAVAARGSQGTRRVQERAFGVRRNDLTPPLSFPELTPAKQKHEFSRAFELVEKWRERHSRLEAENAALKGENTALRAENRELRSRLKAIEEAFGSARAKTA